MPKLNLGPGKSGDGDYKVDLWKIDDRTEVLDLAVEPLPWEDNFFDEIEARHVMEHIPTQIRWKEDGKWHLRFCRVELMRELHRVLKPGGELLIVTPYHWPEWAQDPTHVDVPWTRETIDYFCGEWGGNQEGGEQREGYGINFQFKRIYSQLDETYHQFIVKVIKPR